MPKKIDPRPSSLPDNLRCSRCGSAWITSRIRGFRCRRCGHEWKDGWQEITPEELGAGQVLAAEAARGVRLPYNEHRDDDEGEHDDE